MTRAGQLGLVIVAALLAAGCGGDEPARSTSPEAATATSDAFAARADRICVRGETQISSAFDARYGDDPPPPAELDAFHSDTVVPVSRRTLDRLRRLEPPADDAGRFSALLEKVQAAMDHPSGDPTEGGIGGNPFFTVGDDLAAEFGITQCG
jgi:hypothetical protein